MRDNANFFVGRVVCGSSFVQQGISLSIADFFPEIKEETRSRHLISRINK